MLGSNQDAPVRVFISYSTADSDLANRLKAELESAGADVWLDHERLTPGTPNWQVSIRDGIEQATVVVYVGSRTAAVSPYVIDEIDLARSDGKPVIPFWARGDTWQKCAPLGLGTRQYIDGRGAGFAAGVIKLLATLDVSPQPGSVVIRNVVSHGLGIVAWDPARGRHIGKHLVTAQSLLPLVCTTSVVTTEPYQTSIDVRLLENDTGTDEFDLRDAKEMGSAHFDLPPGLAAGTAIEVTIELSAQGTLRMSALGRVITAIGNAHDEEVRAAH